MEVLMSDEIKCIGCRTKAAQMEILKRDLADALKREEKLLKAVQRESHWWEQRASSSGK
jgi:hypothetical protein